MKVVELLGPSGAGKTFLYHRLFETCADRNYLSVDEACVRAARSLQPVREFSRHALHDLAFRSGLFAFKARGLSRRLLFRDESLFSVTEEYRLGVELLKKYLSAEKSREVFRKRIENLMRCIRLDRVLERQLAKDQVVFFDEGMLHHHHGLDDSLEVQYSTAEIGRDRMLNPAAVIFCELPLELLQKRVLQRRAAGIQTFSHAGLTEPALKKYVCGAVSGYRAKIDALLRRGIPVLTIHTNESISKNLTAVHSFINNLSSS